MHLSNASFRVLSLCVLMSAPLAAQTPPPPIPEIATSADGEVTLAPNRALVRLEIETRGNTAAQASSEAGRKVRAAREAIRALGFPLDSVRTVSFTVTPTYDYQRGQKPVDYRAMASIELTVRSLDKVGAVMDTALAVGVTQIPAISFDSDSATAARNVAFARAMAQARSDAEGIAKAAGGRLGRLLSANSSGSGYPVPRVQMAMTANRAGAPEINGDVVVRVSVQARWEYLAP